MPDHIIGHGTPDSTVVPPTTLSKEENEQEDEDTVLPGWTKASMEEAGSRFHPRLRHRIAERHLTFLNAFCRKSRNLSGSGSERGSMRTVRLGRTIDPGLGDGFEFEGGDGNSDCSIGTVRHVGAGN
jgi:hypothetical protein